MADGLKSFKQDWNRWSLAERATLLALLAVIAAAALIANLPTLF